jgi:hypothetical protein
MDQGPRALRFKDEGKKRKKKRAASLLFASLI